MNLLPQFFFSNQARIGAAAGGGGGLVGLILGFLALFFFELYYNSAMINATTLIGISPSNRLVPVTVMVISIAMFIEPIFMGLKNEKQGLLFRILRTVIGLAIMMLSIPLFIFSLIHWCFTYRDKPPIDGH